MAPNAPMPGTPISADSAAQNSSMRSSNMRPTRAMILPRSSGRISAQAALAALAAATALSTSSADPAAILVTTDWSSGLIESR